MLDYCFDCICPYIWIWKFLITWDIGVDEGQIEIGFYPDYENISWSIEFVNWRTK